MIKCASVWRSSSSSRMLVDFRLSSRDLFSSSFLNFYVQQGTEGVHLLDRLCYLDNFNHSHQITQSEKMLIIPARRDGKLYLLASLLYNLVQKSNFLKTYGQNCACYYVCHTNLSEKSVCFREISSGIACHDEKIIIVALLFVV